ncbi:YadA-like family protein [Veillonella sp. 3960]|uniref:YadA-like family protein n=1 Tax=Veillonella sp. 3960 TaxID=2490955 RepID=UPI000F8DA48A|nr:YadA-like family protein [Veillonella sp. 3960]
MSVAGAANKTAADYADKIWTVGKDTTAAEVTLKGNFNNEGARGVNAVAIGPWANGIGDRSLSVGSHAVAVGKQAITVGQSSFGLGENSLAMGSYATVNGNNSLAIGTDTYVGQATRSGSGKGITATETASEYAMAIGFSAKTLASNAMTIGKGARTEIEHAITLGSASTAVKADADATTAYLTGESVNNSGNGVLSIGNIRNTADGRGVTRRIVGVAGGTNDFDAVNVKQLKKLEENMKAAELHVKKGSYAVDADGNVALPKVNGNDVENADEVVNITGIASKTALETLKTEVAGKASAADLKTAVADINKELAKKVSADEMNEAMANKANASDLQALTEAVKDKVDADTLKNFTDKLGKKADEIKALNDNIARANKANEDAHAALKAEITDKITEAVTELKAAELHTIPDTYAVADDGTVTLKQANGTDPDQAIDAKAYKISGVATKKDIKKVQDDATALSGKVTGLDGKVTDHETRLTAAEADSTAAKNAIDNKVWNTDIDDKVNDLKTELSTNTALQIKGDTTKDKANADTEKYNLNLKDEVLTFKGATDEVTTAVKGNEVTIGLNQAVKDKLAKIDQLGDTSSNGIGKDGGLTGADGLNGKTLTDKVNALRNGEAGSVVFRDDQGNVLTKANDGQLYKKSDVGPDGNPIVGADGQPATPVDGTKIQAVLSNPAGTTDPVKLSNVGAGKIAAGSEDAVNGAQIYAANKSLADALGGGAKVKDDGTIEAPTFNVTDEATGQATPVNTVAGAVTNLDNRITAVANNAKDLAGLTAKGKKAVTDLINVEGKDYITVDTKVDDTTGVKTFTVGLDPQYVGTLTKDIEKLKNSPAGSLRYTDTNGEPIVKGADGNYYRESELKDDGTPKTATENGNKEVKPLGPDDNIQMSLVPPVGKSENGMQLTNIKDGDIKEGSKDAVNGNQIFKANKSIADAIGGGATVKEDGTISEPTFNITKDSTNPAEKEEVHSVGAAIEALDTRINNARNLGDLTTEGKKVITDLINVKGEGNIEVPEAEVDKTTGVKTFTVKLKDTVTLGAKTDDNGVPIEDGKNTTKISDDGVSVVGKGKDGKAATVGIKDGRVTAGDPVDDKGIPKDTGSATSMDKDGFSVATKDKDGKVSKVDIKNGGITAGAPVDDKGIPTEAGTTTSMDKDNGFSVTTKDKDGNVSTVSIKDGKISGLNGAEYNNYEKDKDGKIVTDKDGNPKVASSVKMDGSGLTIAPSTGDPNKSVSLTKDGLNNGGNKITNLAPGEAPTDAATVGQVTEAFNAVGNAVVKNSERISQVGAHSAALAAMNPLSYDPLRKTQVMAGIGSYEGNQALALGVAHYANENFMFNAGFTMGSGKSMANLGATYRFGTGDDDNIPERYKGGPVSSIYVMQDEITALKAENARKDAENAEMKAQIKMLMERMGMA